MLIVDKTMDNTNVNENIDSQNDEILEDEIEETQDEKSERAKSQIDRLKAERDNAKREKDEALRKLQELESKSANADTTRVENKSSDDGFNADKIDNLELKFAGISHKEDRELVLKYAKMNSVSVEEALEESFVKTGLAVNRQARAEQNASIVPNNRVADKSGDATLRKALNHYNKTGEVMDGLDIQTTNKLFNYIKSNK